MSDEINFYFTPVPESKPVSKFRFAGLHIPKYRKPEKGNVFWQKDNPWA